jgi:3-phosphoshikimate 1-carboxyvinyltransferase
MHYPDELEITQLARPPRHVVSVPGSKSITNRALVLAALTPMDVPLRLTDALRSEDTEVMIDCLQRLGVLVEPRWGSREPCVLFPFQERKRIPAETAELFVGNSGTTVRFVAAMLALGRGRYRLDGVPRMRERPIQDLLDALNQIRGVRAASEANTGCPPVMIEANGDATAQRITVRADVSSQFLSALLMVAPYLSDGDTPVDIVVDGSMVSEPYVEMTLRMMRQWGCQVEALPAGYRVRPAERNHNTDAYFIEPDASSASYFFAAAAITGGSVTVRGMKRDMLQGDVKFVDCLEAMGCEVAYTAVGITVTGRPLRGIDVDMNAISDTVMTLAAVACFADGPTTVRNVGHIRHKETDRIAAVATELRKLGAEVEEYPDGLRITPRPLTGCAVDTYNDHRMAMSLALAGLKVPGVVIRNPGCVAKTYPGFWEDFARLG